MSPSKPHTALQTKALKIYKKHIREIHNYSWPLAIYEFGLFALPYCSDYWQPARGAIGECRLCKKQMTDDDHPQKLIECCDEFCGKCIKKWHKTEKKCPVCSVYIDCEDNPDFCRGCNEIGCGCINDDIDEYDAICPVCHYYHENVGDCVAEYYAEVDSSMHGSTSGMLESIEEGDEETETAKREEDILKDTCQVV
jgi:hypothetical protein